nr:hypothetical protein [Sulfurovaceae bacterium]
MKKLLLLLCCLVSLYGNDKDYQEFKEMCQNIRISSHITVSKYETFEDSLNSLKMNALKSLAEEFTGVLIESEFIQKEYSDKNNYKQEIQTYLKTQTNGWIFPKYLYLYDNKTSFYKYDKAIDLLTLNAKLRCNKRVYRELNTKLNTM